MLHLPERGEGQFWDSEDWGIGLPDPSATRHRTTLWSAGHSDEAPNRPRITTWRRAEGLEAGTGLRR